MPAPDRPSRGKQPSFVAREELAPGAVRAPRSLATDTAVTAPPPAPDRRPPPKEFRRSSTRQPGRSVDEGWPDNDSAAEPPRTKPTSDEILVAELATKAEQARRAEVAAAEAAEQARRAEAEAAELRQALDAARRAPPPVASLTPIPDRKAWHKQLYAFLGACTLFLGGAGTYLGARAATKEKVDDVVAVSSANQVVVSPLPGQVADLERSNAALREWARKHADFDRQIFGKLGVKIHEPPNALPVDPIKTTARVRKPNSVIAGPVLEVDTDPPTLP